MVKLIIRPIVEVVNEELIERKTQEYMEQILGNAKLIAENLYLIDPPALRATPSLFSYDCVVKALIRLRIGSITNMDGIRNLARGRAIHDLYQDWFKAVNPRVHVEIESGIETADTSGRADIVYMREVDGEERWGLIELKSSWNLQEDKERRYIKQVMSYVHMLEEAGIPIKEAYLVTMKDVKALPLGRLKREYNNIMNELKMIENMQGWLPEPPDVKLCTRCELKSICITYNNYISNPFKNTEVNQ